MLICPLCQGLLEAFDGGVACPANHRFDRARQGYLNLLPVQHKNSRAPGDNQQMVQARQRFLEASHYEPLATRLATIAACQKPTRWLDIGCGEGYYTARLTAALNGADGYALDISRDAIKHACRRDPRVSWLVASMARVPLASASCDLLASVFSPLDWSEARRLLSPGGGLLRMGPTRDHLRELRALLYDEVREYDDEKHLAQIPIGMQLAQSETLSYELQLDDPGSRADLLAMTPHGWRATAERRARVIDTALRVRVAIRYDWIVRDETP
ncbi:putative RNA methyltransferase [Stutzerimonas tarimensis]|uniref:RNA methyltransferase n=1 Tax=Stutzerimonas tarimensis TaxID=1507735 RepID=A0ABV7T0J6_9GAMM